MKDQLLDLIQHVYGIDSVDLAKITETSTETNVVAYPESKTVVAYGKYPNAVFGFEGVFGMPNLPTLKTILGFDEYDENSSIKLVTKTDDGEVEPFVIHFETQGSDFINDYRLMKKSVVEDKIKNPSFKGATWDVTFEPSAAGIIRLKKQAQANNTETNFSVRLENGDLKIFIGDNSSHSGNFVFHTDLQGKLTRAWQYPIKAFVSIMELPGTKVIQFSDAGVVEITVDSGLATWQYFLPALTK